MSRGLDASAVIAELSREIDATLGPLFGEAACALVDFPGHSNIGDHAVWSGQRAYLRRTGRPIAYVCAERSYDPGTLSRAIGKGTILLSGGGNFGDLYPRHQRLRERVLRDFPANRVVQLPQSIEFHDMGTAARTRVALERHPDFTLVVRESRSLTKAREWFPNTDCRLCPDMSMSLGPLSRLGTPRADVLAVRRRDTEALGGAPTTPGSVPETDWRRPALLAGVSLLTRAVAPGAAKDAALGAVSHMYVRRGRRILSRGRTIVTDRLHGHLMALAMGIPHVLCDNSYGKVRGFFETWTSSCPLVTWASSWDEALTIAS